MWQAVHVVTMGSLQCCLNRTALRLDSVPGEVNSADSDGEVEKVLHTLHSLPLSLPSRKDSSYWSLLEHPPKGLEIAIVRAENSDRWHPYVLQNLEDLSKKGETAGKRKVSLQVVPKSGHWVHVDNPKGLLEIMAPNFIKKA